MEPTTTAAAAIPAAGGGSMNALIFMFIAFMLVFLFLSSRTNKKRETEQKKMISALQKGDKVILRDGIVGVVAGFNDNLVEVKISENLKLSVLPSGIVSVYQNIIANNQANGAK